MPFTLAHPLAILPLPRRYFHFPALVLGSMSPDFIYFLSGKPTNGGHTILMSEGLNLPLCLLFYGIYRLYLRQLFQYYLPRCWATNAPSLSPANPLLWLLVFSYSAWIGMLTHIGLDNFTHPTGYFVQQWAWLREQYYFPIYKWLQYSLSIIGMAVIGWYQYQMACRYPYLSQKSSDQKGIFWCGNGILTAIGFAIWYQFSPLNWDWYGIIIIRWIDCLLLSLLASGIYWRYVGKE